MLLIEESREIVSIQKCMTVSNIHKPPNQSKILLWFVFTLDRDDWKYTSRSSDRWEWGEEKRWGFETEETNILSSDPWRLWIQEWHHYSGRIDFHVREWTILQPSTHSVHLLGEFRHPVTAASLQIAHILLLLLLMKMKMKRKMIIFGASSQFFPFTHRTGFILRCPEAPLICLRQNDLKASPVKWQ